MAKNSPGSRNRLRIVAGVHRGRKLSFPDAKGLRPTTDRVRETLFNWLQPTIHGACCLDLFAGSGALGFEALSREASQVTFVDKSAKVIQQIKTNVDLLSESNRAKVLQADSLKLVETPADDQYDLVFLDPPFVDKVLSNTLRKLIDNQWLTANAVIYQEQDSRNAWEELPEGWSVFREGKAGQAAFRLIKCQQQ